MATTGPGGAKIYRLTEFDSDGRPVVGTERVLEYENGQLKSAETRRFVEPAARIAVPWTFYGASLAVLIGFVFIVGFYHILAERYYGWVTSIRGSTTSFFDHAVVFGFVTLVASTTYYMCRALLVALLYSWGRIHLVEYQQEIKLPAGEFADIVRFMVDCSLAASLFTGKVTLCVALVIFQIIFIASVIDKPVSITYNGGSHWLSGAIDYVSNTWGTVPNMFSLSAVPVGAQIGGGVGAIPAAVTTVPIAASQPEIIYDPTGRPIDPYQARFRNPRYGY